MKSKCSGSGTEATNVTRAYVGDRLPMVGTCSTCDKQVEITRQWTVKSHG